MISTTVLSCDCKGKNAVCLKRLKGASPNSAILEVLGTLMTIRLINSALYLLLVCDYFKYLAIQVAPLECPSLLPLSNIMSCLRDYPVASS
jgi:hypothetical protein